MKRFRTGEEMEPKQKKDRKSGAIEGRRGFTIETP